MLGGHLEKWKLRTINRKVGKDMKRAWKADVFEIAFP